MASPNPKDFFPNGKTHSELAATLGCTEAGLSSAISKGTYPFKKCRIKAGKNYIYDFDRCLQVMIDKTNSQLA